MCEVAHTSEHLAGERSTGTSSTSSCCDASPCIYERTPLQQTLPCGLPRWERLSTSPLILFDKSLSCSRLKEPPGVRRVRRARLPRQFARFDAFTKLAGLSCTPPPSGNARPAGEQPQPRMDRSRFFLLFCLANLGVFSRSGRCSEFQIN